MPYKMLAENKTRTVAEPHRWETDYRYISQHLGVDLKNDDYKIVVNLGGGVDAIAVILEMYARRIRPDVIVFSWVGRDTSGDEWPSTYRTLIHFSGWLQQVGFPAIDVINYEHKQDRYAGLYEKVLRNGIYNSSSFGKHSCSAFAKGELIDRWVKTIYADEIEAGYKIVRVIGLEAEETDRVARMERMFKTEERACKGNFAVTNREEKQWEWSFPMVVWGMTRAIAEDLCDVELGFVPDKSACYHCGFGKEREFLKLADQEPYLASRVVDLEAAVDHGGKVRKEFVGIFGGGRKGRVRKSKGVYTGEWLSELRTGRATELWRKHGLLEKIEAARPTFLTLGVPEDLETPTIHDLDDRADAAREAREANPDVAAAGMEALAASIAAIDGRLTRLREDRLIALKVVK